ncbi:polysaccharide biosynthesis tyrosine autokinase [Pelomonas sp. KK5]|uniref:polysaccharide biosynthesis tyrosine autokinase n=1 Tax=Pelomonas sp. KK5 TaxID=1855730 RepID=UPI001E57C5CC|nr:polysaccharide biosynthesis tyrosine autokinase [Pelomonas sp. KK5]
MGNNREFPSLSQQAPTPDGEHGGSGLVLDRSIGDFLSELKKLSNAQIEQVLAYQRQHGVRFGEAAVALKLASQDDVMWALSKQFHYPYSSGEGAHFNEELVAAIDPFSEQTESFRGIRSQLMLGVMAADAPKRALALLSPNVGDGKTFFAANLAVVFSQLGAKTLLIDADMRTPRQHRLFGIPAERGLSSVLSGRAETNVVRPIRDLPSLFVMPVGTLPPNPLELLQRPAFGLLLQELLSKFDHVIVDTPASAHGADSRVLAAKCGAAMVVTRRNVSQMKAVHKLVGEVARGSAQFAGVVINEH